VVKHRPPGNRNPAPDEVAACSPYLIRQLELVRPKVILTVGNFAAQTLLDTKLGIGKLRGQVHLYRGCRSWPRTTPPRSCATPPGSAPPGKMSSLPVDFSIAPPPRVDPYHDRRPPFSQDAEQAVLGAMLLDQDAILRAGEHVDDTMFYREGHRRIFRAVLALSERGEVAEPLTLAEELARRGSSRRAAARSTSAT
jgi:hypothetical protein